MSTTSFPTLATVFKAPQPGKDYLLNGWIRHKRQTAKVLFLVLTDGSTQSTLQAVGTPGDYAGVFLRKLSVGASVALSGTLVATPKAAQPYELQLKSIQLLGEADPDSYPLQPKAHSYPFLRSIAHLRPRTATFGAILRVRHAATYAIHSFFHEQGFFHVHTPVIAAADAEGAGEMFGLRTGKFPDTSAFFGRPAHLTVSGQLEAELLAMGLSRVYTFGPTFRAEHSNTKHHLSEFWMLEPEAAFYTLPDCIELACCLFQAVLSQVLVDAAEEISFLDEQQHKQQLQLPLAERQTQPLRAQLQQLASQPVVQLTYTEAFTLLARSTPNRKGKFTFPLREWGQDLQAEHEHYLVKHCAGAVIVRDYPAENKAFYMRLNQDKKTVAAMDLLLPRVGELVGGSQREERLDVLQQRMTTAGLDKKELSWYLDTRRYGTVPHSGFGLGFERLIQLLTGMDNIRDVIPFPRSVGQLTY